jgi:hypothetical protein
MTAKSKREAPLKVPMAFDEAMRRVVQVKPPKEGWEEYEKKLKKERKRRKPKKAA